MFDQSRGNSFFIKKRGNSKYWLTKNEVTQKMLDRKRCNSILVDHKRGNSKMFVYTSFLWIASALRLKKCVRAGQRCHLRNRTNC